MLDWVLLQSGRLYPCLKVMLVFCGIPLVFTDMIFIQCASLVPITSLKAVPLFKGNDSVVWYTTGVQGNDIVLVC